MGWFYHSAQWKVTTLLGILDAGKAALAALDDCGTEIEQEGGAFGDTQNDPELTADRILGEKLSEEVALRIEDIGRITVEGGQDRVFGDAKRNTWVTIDPIDASLNYYHRGVMTGFPHVAVITVLDVPEGRPCQFSDVVAAGMIDLRRNISDAWLVGICPDSCRYESYVRGADGRLHVARTLQMKKLDIGRANLIGEMYYEDNRERMVRAFAGKKGWLRSPGSAAYEMGSVMSALALAQICLTQKQHELGAGYALVKGAGGVAVDWDGKDLGERIYDFKTQTPCILAANQQIADQILELLNRS